MTAYYLIRHGATDYIGRALSGRASGVSLNELGMAQAVRLATRMEAVRLSAIYSSPLERAIQTAQPLAQQLGVEIEISTSFNELNFGDWTGRTFPQLENDPEWRRFNSFRSSTRAPGGEHMLEVQARTVAELERMRLAHPGQEIAIVSHADVIRAAICHYSGIPLDLFHRVEIGLASISILTLDEHGPQIRSVNIGESIALT